MNTDLRRRRILLTGWINLNVVDGSAYFLPALATALAGDPFTDVELVSAVPLRREQVVGEVRDIPNVTVVDPWRELERGEWARYEMGVATGTREGLARFLHDRDRERPADVVIVRDTFLADAMVAEDPTLASRLVVYVTGITFAGLEPDPEVVEALQRLSGAGVAAFALQTEAMHERFLALVPGCEPGRAFVLHPMVAASAAAEAEPVAEGVVPARLIYTGKFAAGWNPRQIIAGFRAARRADPRLTLTMVGDQIQADPEDEDFAPDMKRLLGSDDIWWTGAVERRVSRALVRQHDVGISWRAAHMDQSLELSTKLLEYGLLGRPCIINRNPMHERIFGADYPFYATTTAEFIRQLETLGDRADEYRAAAHRVQRIAADYTYEKGRERLEPVLRAVTGADERLPLDLTRPVGEWLRPEQLGDSGALVAVGGRGRFDAQRGADDPDTLGSLVSYLAEAEMVRQGRRRAEEAADAQLDADVTAAPAAGQGGASELAVGRLRQQLAQEKELRAAVEARLKALRSSRLGTVQTRYWAWKADRRR